MKRRIAILGGGCGSMATAWALTQLPGWQEQYDITVYQMGWRLGGKGASGRDETNSWRVLEHGLHLWSGFYENAFRVMQQSYAALPLDTGTPLAAWDDAFRKLSTVILQEDIGGKTLNWQIDFPENDDIPGTSGTVPSPWQFVLMIIREIEKAMSKSGPAPEERPLTDQVEAALGEAESTFVSLFHRLFAWHYAGQPQATSPPKLDSFHHADVIGAAGQFANSLSPDPATHLAAHHEELLHLLEEGVRLFVEKKSTQAADDNDIRRLLLIIDFALVMVRGIVRDGVLISGWEVINHQEWREWLRANGAPPATVDSALVRGIYDYVFGFVKGTPTDRSIEAGTATHGCLRLFFTFKGAIFWEMQGGMGDVVFAPMYRVLEARGVKFEFFHKVTNLAVGADKSVDRIELLRQANVKADSYKPLVVVNGVHSWPAHPRYEQLVEGEQLRSEKINLESAWTAWSGTPVTLTRGVDFDEVVLGIALGALPDIASEVSAASTAFKTMLDKVMTVQTAGMQLWLNASAERLGASPIRRAATACAEPIATWSDMSFLLAREQWSPDNAPRYIAYFCGELPDLVIPPYSDHEFPQRMLADFRKIAVDWLKANTASIWSKATEPGKDNLDWSLLHDPENREGEARLDAQFFRVNIDPSERYVASFPGTSQYRLSPDKPVLPNLFITGDWTKTVFNAGCVEAAMIAGLYAARAISGAHIEIVGG